MEGNQQCDINGHVEPGFEEVKKQFEKLYSQGMDTDSQLCVYVGDKKVIDIWGASKDKGYTPDSVSIIYSSGKSLSPICMAIMKDKGLIKYEEKIGTYWPEFAQNGKENITVTDILRHEAGLDKLGATIE